jgi:hypothetical protein
MIDLALYALKRYGKEWKKVAAMVRTRTVVQTRTHAQKQGAVCVLLMDPGESYRGCHSGQVGGVSDA